MLFCCKYTRIQHIKRLCVIDIFVKISNKKFQITAIVAGVTMVTSLRSQNPTHGDLFEIYNKNLIVIRIVLNKRGTN